MVTAEGNYKYKPLQFFLIAYVITWACWLTAGYLSYHPTANSAVLISVLEPAGLFGPFIAALFLIFTSGSPLLKKEYLRKIIDLRTIGLSSLLIAVLLLPLVDYISIVASWLFFGKSMGQLALSNAAAFSAGMLPAPVMLFAPALLEELGWKGYGMDSLRGNRTFFTATLIYAVIWALWHTPLFFINGYFHNLMLRANPLFALNFYISVIPMAFISNWLWHRCKGNILVAVILHGMVNTQGLIQMSQTAKFIQTGALLVVAGVIVWREHSLFSIKPNI